MSAEAAEVAWDELTLSPDEYRRASTRYRRRRSRTAYLFVLPYLIPFLAFLVVPVFWSIWLSFNKGGLLDEAKFVGLQNWREIADDTELTGSIKNTAIYVVEAIFLVFTLALFLALLLNRYRKGSNVFKLALYVPLLAPAVLVGLIWQFVTNYDFGLLNLILTTLGVERVNIFGDGTLVAAHDRVRRGLARARVLDAVLPRQPAERAGGAARRGAGRRREGGAALQARHAPDAPPDAAVRGRDRDHRQLPGVRHRVRPHPGRARTSRPPRSSGSSGRGCSSSSRPARATPPPCSCSGSSSC